MIGAGLIGRRHLELVIADPNCELVAVCDPWQGAAETAAQYGVPYFQSYVDMLAQMELDGAIIATPNQTHAEIGIACAETWGAYVG